MGLKLSPTLTRSVLANSSKLDRVTLSLPPSTNGLFTSVKGKNGKTIRVKSKAYTAWHAVAVPKLWSLNPPKTYPCTFFWLVVGKIDTRRDGDNLLKPLVDAVVNAGVIPDDSVRYVRGWCGHVLMTDDEPSVQVWLEEMAP